MKQKLIILFTLLALAVAGMCQDFPAPMLPRRIVNDYARIFTPQQQNALEQRVRAFDDSTSTQIAIVTVSDLNGYAVNDYAQRLGEAWGVGQKGKDNGIVILIKPKTVRSRGEVAISVGYGLEGVIPDAIASRIVRNEMIPAFQQGSYYQGVVNALNVITNLSRGEYTATQYAKHGARAGNGGNFPFFALPFVLFFILPLFFKRRRGFTTGSHTHGSVPPIFFGGMGHSRGGFDSFSSGRGGFGGFGGGGFGGGGASGSW
ncbi:MAG: TPM domain-containing protein [Marinifilaceae bacterium]